MNKRPSDGDMAFIQYCIHELGIETSPRIKIGDDHAKAQEFKAMGAYFPYENEIWVLRGERVPADWYRTLAHELVHWRQRERGQDLNGSDGSEIENEANSMAAVILRQWGRNHPEIYVRPVNEAQKTECLTPGAVYNIKVGEESVQVEVDLGFKLDLTSKEAAQLEGNLHNAVELALASVWKTEEHQSSVDPQ